MYKVGRQDVGYSLVLAIEYAGEGAPPLKYDFFLRKIVIFHTKYPKKF